VITLGPADVLVLDLDDTLYPEWTYVRSGLHFVDRWVHARWDRSGFFAAAWRSFTSGTRGRLFDDALATLGIEPSRSDITSMVATYREHQPDIALYPDAIRLLDRVPGNLRVALITDGAAASQRHKIAALGLDRRIKTIVVTDELGRHFWKPSLVPFERVASATGADYAQLVYVGDNVFKDFAAPNALGWRSVRVLRED